MTSPPSAATERRPAPRRTAGRIVAAVVGLTTIVLTVLLGGPGSGPLPLDPASAEPDGLLGLVRLLEASDVRVRVADDVPEDLEERVLVPSDELPERRRDQLRRFAEDGGTVVVAGAAEPIHGLRHASGSVLGALGRTARGPECDALGQVEEVFHDDWSAFEVPDDATACFPTGADTAWLVARSTGAGTVVALGSATPWTNALLAEADNAVLAATLLGPEPGDGLTIVRRGEVGAGETPLLDLVPPGVTRALWLLGAALLTGVLWRARRLGPPVAERLPPVLPSAELARSVAHLLQRAGDRGAAARRIRDDIRHEACRILGVPRTTPGGHLVELVERRSHVEGSDAELALLDGDVEDDDTLTRLASAAARVRDGLQRPSTYRGSPDRDPGPDPTANPTVWSPT